MYLQSQKWSWHLEILDIYKAVSYFIIYNHMWSKHLENLFISLNLVMSLDFHISKICFCLK